jgi:hypothetical protein
MHVQRTSAPAAAKRKRWPRIRQVGVAAAAYVSGACLGALYAPMMAGTGPVPGGEAGPERQIEVIEPALDQRGPIDRRRLAGLVGARYWGPGRFGLAVQEAVREGRVRRLSRTVLAPVER